ncbi:hypothetical protein D918_03591 [Trichuris suis]|nr:hypothetical protein D918_03591 [Trichuris suis]
MVVDTRNDGVVYPVDSLVELVVPSKEQKKEAELYVTMFDCSEKRGNNYAALVFVLLFVLIGLPIWWMTTRVYRANLPYDRIRELSQRELILPLNVTLIWLDGSDKELANAIRNHLENTLSRRRVSEHLVFDFRYTSRAALDEERAKLFGPKLSATMKAVQCNFSTELLGNLLVFLLPVGLSVPYRTFVGCQYPPDMYVIADGQAVELSARIAHHVLHVFIKEARLASLEVKSLQSASPENVLDANFSTLRSEYALELFVVDPAPDGLPKVEAYSTLYLPIIDKFLGTLSPVVQTSITSQMLYYIDFPVAPSNNGSFHYLEAEKLPHLINSMESYMGSYVTTRPVVRLLVYLTPQEVSPLYILKEDGSIAMYNSFVVNGWGGVVIVNDDASKGLGKNAQLAMVALLRNFLGLGTDQSIQRRRAPICPWELQMLMYHACADNALTSVRTLTSLISLLNRISNIVINDEVASRIDKSVIALQAVYSSLTMPVNLTAAALNASIAYRYSEQAFFDHSLLSLLYFPEDQKYAIYVPLFLPVCFPVVLSVFRMVRSLKYAKTKQE